MSCTVPTEATLSEIAADVAREMVVRAQRDDFSVESDPETGISRMHVIARVRHGRAWLWSGRKEEPSEHDS